MFKIKCKLIITYISFYFIFLQKKKSQKFLVDDSKILNIEAKNIRAKLLT